MIAEHPVKDIGSDGTAELSGRVGKAGGLGRRPRLWHQEPKSQHGEKSHRCDAQKYDRAPKNRSYEAEQRGAQRSTDSGCCSDEALGEIKATGAIRQVGNDECRHHANRCSADTIQQLKGKEQRRIGDQSEQQRTDRQCAQSDEEKRPSAPVVRLSSDPWRHQGNNDLRQDDQCRYYERGTAFSLIYESLSDKRQHRRIGELK